MTSATSNLDTSLSLNLEETGEFKSASDYTVYGKLIDSVSNKPISGKTITITTDGNSPDGSDTTDRKGEFEISLKTPDERWRI